MGHYPEIFICPPCLQCRKVDSLKNHENLYTPAVNGNQRVNNRDAI